MHRRPEVKLLPFDIELERTLRNMKKVRIVVMVEQEETNQNEPVTVAERP